MEKSDFKSYTEYQKEQQSHYESICRRCGECCGAGRDERCSNLVLQKDGTYFCKDYENRLGEQKTITGKKFNCVPIRSVLRLKDTLPNCSYRNKR